MTLPQGWEARTDPQSGRTYYQNNLTTATQWEPPLASAPPLPPLPPLPNAGYPGYPGAGAGADYLLKGLQATNRSRCWWQLVRLLTRAHCACADCAYISCVGVVTAGCYRAHAPDLPSVGRGDIFDRVLCGRGSRSAEKVHPCADIGRGHTITRAVHAQVFGIVFLILWLTELTVFIAGAWFLPPFLPLRLDASMSNN